MKITKEVIQSIKALKDFDLDLKLLRKWLEQQIIKDNKK